MPVPKKVLSASRIKTLQGCSWVYYCNYILYVPQKQNDGALRGTVCHTVFEILLKPRHRKHYDTVIAAGTIQGSKGLARLVKKHLFKVGIKDDENHELVDKMILVGLKYDFFCEGGKILDPEFKFELTSDKPSYKITGFIDKPAVYEKEKIIKITDYKSSKQKFSGDDLEANTQAMLYSLAARKLWPDLKPVVQFLFLRFPRQPVQELQFSDAQLRGFAASLEYLNKLIDNFDEKSAQNNFAYDNKGYKWMCGRGNWRCPYRDASTYYSVIDESGKHIKSAFDKSLLICGEKQKIVEKTYDGCPKFKRKEQPDGYDPFSMNF
jgi:hypothetical protein